MWCIGGDSKPIKINTCSRIKFNSPQSSKREFNEYAAESNQTNLNFLEKSNSIHFNRANLNIITRSAWEKNECKADQTKYIPFYSADLCPFEKTRDLRIWGQLDRCHHGFHITCPFDWSEDRIEWRADYRGCAMEHLDHEKVYSAQLRSSGHMRSQRMPLPWHVIWR
jgi:hypothetical protein